MAKCPEKDCAFTAGFEKDLVLHLEQNHGRRGPAARAIAYSAFHRPDDGDPPADPLTAHMAGSVTQPNPDGLPDPTHDAGFPCPEPGCGFHAKTARGLGVHRRFAHGTVSPHNKAWLDKAKAGGKKHRKPAAAVPPPESAEEQIAAREAQVLNSIAATLDALADRYVACANHCRTVAQQLRTLRQDLAALANQEAA